MTIIPLQSDIDLIYPLISGGISGDIPPAPDIPLASFYTVYSPLHCCQHVIFFFSTILSGSRWRLGQKSPHLSSVPLSVLSRGASTQRNRSPGKFTSWTVFSKVLHPRTELPLSRFSISIVSDASGFRMPPPPKGCDCWGGGAI